MTEVAFHFNAPDKLAYACRCARKVQRSGARLVIAAPPDTLAALDRMQPAGRRGKTAKGAQDSDGIEITSVEDIRF